MQLRCISFPQLIAEAGRDPRRNPAQRHMLERFGHPGGSYLAPDGTPFPELALPPESAVRAIRSSAVI